MPRTFGRPPFLPRLAWKPGSIVSAIEFVESPYYLGLTLWPSQKNDLFRIFHTQHHPLEVVFSGAPGTAKSTRSALVLTYTLYLLSRLRDPQKALNMSPFDEIFIVCQSTSTSVAGDSVFERVKNMVDRSQYFNQHFQRSQKHNFELMFPNKITVRPLTGDANAALGLNVIAGVISEVNFMMVSKKSKKLAFSDKDEYDLADDMCRKLKNRILSRFSRLIEDGDFPGRLVIESAVNHPGDCTSRKAEEAKDDPTVLVIWQSQWEARAHEYVGEPMFPVLRPNDYRPGRILPLPQEPVVFGQDTRNIHVEGADHPDEVIWIPERHRKEFAKDFLEALKYFAGITGAAKEAFIANTVAIRSAGERFAAKHGDGESLFITQETALGQLFSDGIDWNKLINYDFLAKLRVSGDAFAMHLDTSLSGDNTGFAVGRLVGLVHQENACVFDPETGIVVRSPSMKMPVYEIVGILRILASKGEQIPLAVIQALGLELKRHINVAYATADWLESAQLLQAWSGAGIMAEALSVDKDAEPYHVLKHAILEERITYPEHHVLQYELTRLQRRTSGRTIIIDHPKAGSKDVADAMCGVVFVLQRTEAFRAQTGGTKKQGRLSSPATSSRSGKSTTINRYRHHHLSSRKKRAIKR